MAQPRRYSALQTLTRSANARSSSSGQPARGPPSATPSKFSRAPPSSATRDETKGTYFQSHSTHQAAGEWFSLSWGLIITHILGGKLHESRRDSATKPRVARNELPWVHRVRTSQPHRGCVRGWRVGPQPRWCWDAFWTISQGSSQARNPGLEATIPLGLALTAFR